MFDFILRAILLAFLALLAGILFIDAMMEPIVPPVRVVRVQV